MSEQSNSSYEDLDAIEATSEEGRILNNLFSSPEPCNRGTHRERKISTRDHDIKIKWK